MRICHELESSVEAACQFRHCIPDVALCMARAMIALLKRHVASLRLRRLLQVCLRIGGFSVHSHRYVKQVSFASVPAHWQLLGA